VAGDEKTSTPDSSKAWVSLEIRRGPVACLICPTESGRYRKYPYKLKWMSRLL